MKLGFQPISLISPSDSTPVNGLPVLAWSEPAPITRYRVQIAEDTAFTKLIFDKTVTGSSYAVLQSDLIGTTALVGKEYCWRVAGAAESLLMSKTGKIQMLESGVVYVATNSSSTLQIGNRTSPFRKIGPALVSADTRRSGALNTPYEVRVASGVYNEDILMPPGIALRGGYALGDWTQNIATNISHITALSTTAVTFSSAVSLAYRDTTILEGFTVTGGSSNLAANYALFLVSASPTIRYNTIRGGGSTTKENYGIFLSASNSTPAPRILNNTITHSIVSTSGTAHGIYLQGSSSIIEKNLILPASISGLSYGIGVDHTRATNITIRNNVIHAGTTSASGSAAISIAYSVGSAVASVAGTVLIQNNTLNGGSSTGETLGVEIVDLSGGVINVNVQNNIVLTAGGAGRVCVFERNSDSLINILTNNLLFDSPAGLYYDLGFDFYTTITSGKPGGVDVATTVTSGTVTAASTAAVFAAGYNVSNLKSWIILSGGPADIAGGTGWSGIGVDIGAETATAGPP